MKRQLLWVALLLLAVGCSREKPPAAPPLSDTPTVQLVKAEPRTIVRTVGQPGFIDAYEQTSIYAKVAGYVQEWKVDIDAQVKKGDLLLLLSVPELVEQLEQAKAQVGLDQEQIKQAQKLVEVAEGNLKATIAQVTESQANVGRYQSEMDFWAAEVKRLGDLVKQNVLDKQNLDEAVKQLRSNTAARDAARAAVQTASANQLAAGASRDKARTDVDVAKAQTKVAEANARRLAALLGYTQVTAPYDGVVTVRNVNTGDFVQPAAGDPSAAERSADQSSTRAAPLYVVARTDKVRIYVDVPEMDANYVHRGTKARVRVQALGDAEVEGSVTRTSWALNVKSRTLRAEIDLPNPGARLRPGMYAYGRVLIERQGVRALPKAALIEIGNQTCCFLYEDGKAVKTPVQTGVSDGTWVEVTRKLVGSPGTDGGNWEEFTGSEEVIVGELADLVDGQKVAVGKQD